MAFLTEPEPERGRATEMGGGVLRLVARNPSKMTYHGTNTYLVPQDDGFIVLDPGPASNVGHVDDIVAATGGRITAILLSHGHADHSGAVPALRARCAAPVLAFSQQAQSVIIPDVLLSDGDVVGPLTALHTPGHAPDHLCFDHADGFVFTADHVMGWSSSVVSPPSGSMADYLASLQRLIDRNDALYFPGHGPALRNPRAYVADLRDRRMRREEEILAIVASRPMTTDAIARMLYHKPDPILQAAAERNVLAHLLKLRSEGKVTDMGNLWTGDRAASLAG
jgi:glyoxylase-like metal-dependent hydrolase (beta-lactamase superfamily II)